MTDLRNLTKAEVMAIRVREILGRPAAFRNDAGHLVDCEIIAVMRESLVVCVADDTDGEPNKFRGFGDVLVNWPPNFKGKLDGPSKPEQQFTSLMHKARRDTSG